MRGGGRLIVWAILSFCCSQASVFAMTDPIPAAMKRIRFVGVKACAEGTRVIIRGDGRIPTYTTRTMVSPPRIIVDINCRVLPFKSVTRSVSGSILKTVRIGHHSRSIRLVLALNGSILPGFSCLSRSDELLITLQCDPQAPLETKSDEQARRPFAAEGNVAPAHVENPQTVSRNTISTKARADREIDRRESKPPVGVVSGTVGLEPMERRLMQGKVNDGREDSALFGDGVDAYRSENWMQASVRFNELIKKYPGGRYTERAYFLRAKAFDQMHLGSISEHFKETKRRYEDAAYRYPESIHVPDAHVSIGNLCLRVKNYSEALGYFNLVIDKENDSEAALRALMQKATILALTHKKEQTLSLYAHVISRYPETPEATVAKIGKAKILFEMNQFQQSLEILTALEKRRENKYAYPDLFRYLGNNYYQLGKRALAKKHLFRYYNLCPQEKDSHLILARIADIYREEGAITEATKLYKLVLERYPKTEGALIGMYRLAEQQEAGEIRIDKKLAPDLNIIDSEVQMPRKIYEDVIRNALEKDEKNPLIQFALLKLSILQKKEKNYDKSLKILKELLATYPHTRLKNEIYQALRETLEYLLRKDFKTKRFKSIINVYQAEKKLIVALKSADVFIIIARACAKLGLNDMAIEMFKNAEPLLTDEQKPDDLLLTIGRDAFEKEEYPKALGLIEILLHQHADSPYGADARLLKGKMLLAGQNPRAALGLFEGALAQDLKRCRQIDILLSMTRALIEIDSSDRALKTVKEAGRLSKSCPDSDYRRYLEIAGLFMRLKDFQGALAVMTDARDAETDEKNKIRLELLMARCYESLNQKGKYLAIYDGIANRNDPFWSSLARERMEEIQFESSLRKGKK